MRERDEVMEKFREVRDAKLKERMREYLCRSPHNCVDNERLRVHGKGVVGFCQNAAVLGATKKGMFVCNDPSVAERCRVFKCRNTEESVRSDFEAVLASPARCGSEYPKLAMLIWFLQDFGGTSRARRLGSLLARALGSMWKAASFRWW